MHSQEQAMESVESTGARKDHDLSFAVALDIGSCFTGIAFACRDDPDRIIFCPPDSFYRDKRGPSTVFVSASTTAFFSDAYARYMGSCFDSIKQTTTYGLFGHYKSAICGAVTDGSEATDALMEVVIKYVRALVLRARAVVEEFDEKRVMWVIPVPAMWDDSARALLRTAVYQAGAIESDQSEKLMLVLEPEVAALGIWDSLPEVSLLDEGDRFLTLHCGGGLIEILVQEVISLSPLRLETVSAPVSLTTAGESVWANFQGFLKVLLGEQNYSERVVDFDVIHLQQSFVHLSESYDPRYEPDRLRILDFLESRPEGWALMQAYNETHPATALRMPPAVHHGFLYISKELMLSFYEPSLSAVVSAIHAKLAEVPNVKQIVMTGGFSDSPVVQQRIMQEFHLLHGGVRVALPPKRDLGYLSAASLAVAKGAVLFAQSVINRSADVVR
jgi:hypothetical protein